MSAARPLRPLLWIGLLAGRVWALWAVPIGRPQAPPPTDVADLTAWFGQASGPDQAMAILRAVALIAAVYLLAVSIAMAWAERTGSIALQRLVRVFTPAAIRSAIAPMVGWAMFVAPLPISQLSVASGESAPPPALELVFLGAPSADTSAPPLELRALPALTDLTTTEPASSADFVGVLAEPADQWAMSSIWLVESGDHFWSIAQRVLIEADGASPSNDRLTEYWSELIEVNRPSLPDPGNPDLILPGMTLNLPPVPEAA
jgi:nucleoid-associated protein YgaU